MCCVHEFSELNFILELSQYSSKSDFYVYCYLYKSVYRSFWTIFAFGSSCPHLLRSMEVVATLWLASIAIISARVAEKRVGDQIRDDCNSCNILSEDQRVQLSTPSYRLKKEKRDLKKSTDTPKQDSSSSSLIDPSSVTVVGVVDDQGIVKSPGSSSDKRKKTNQPDKAKDTKTSSDKPSKSLTKTHRSSPDTRIDELDQKWSERFNRLEAILLSKSMDKEPTFAPIKVTPAHSPPQSSAISSRPFIKPGQNTDQLATDLASQRPVADQAHDSVSSDLPGNPQTASKSTGKSSRNKVSTDQRSDVAGTDSPSSQQVPSRASSAPARRNSVSSMDTDSDTDLSDRPPVDLFVEEGELSDDLEATGNDPDLAPSEEQTYRETMSGIRSFMGWSHIPEMDTTASRSEDNPFAGPKAHPTGKVSVTMPTDEWLCNKMAKINLTLTEGYPSRSSEAGGLLKDQFVRPPKSQAKWYNFAANPEKCNQGAPQTVSTWNTDASKVNSSYSRIAKAACFPSNFTG